MSYTALQCAVQRIIGISIVAALSATPVYAQAPLGAFAGRWVDAGVLHQAVSNDFGDWTGAYVRAIVPVGSNDIWWAEVVALEAFGSRGVQGSLTQRHDWNSRFFTMVGVAAADGAPIFARVRADALLGFKLAAARNVVATVGVSHVRSVDVLTDAALTGSIAWYAPRGFIFETSVRANTSWPGRIRTARYSGATTWMGARRSFTLRGTGGEEGWQILNVGTALTRFSSHEISLSWRERIGERWTTAVQLDRYENPTYTRTGVTAGLARSW